ncbi:MAG: antitoxin family protein [Chloroflexota bacterium]|nr:antitoxin family protein [Chloroflexota bacterium]MDE2885578.1 antitoxin family protein [Chloroflexota bacterium]
MQLKARFSKGVLKPLERLDLKEGTEVLITLDIGAAETGEQRRRRSKASAGAWGNPDDGERLKRVLQEARVAGSRDRQELS